MKATLESEGSLKDQIQIQLGGSKSESNRLLILQAQFPNISIENLSSSDDTLALIEGLKQKKGTVNIGHAGTAMRFLTAFYAAKEGVDIILTGSDRMQQRPIGILVQALITLGADIQYLQKEGFPPLHIKGKKLSGKMVKVPSDVSSQFLSALMLVAPSLTEGLIIFMDGKPVSEPYLTMTLSLLQKVGINAKYRGKEILVSPKKHIERSTVSVESDWSSASYFYSLVALSKDSEIQLNTFSETSLQGDAVLPIIYENLGVHTQFGEGTLFLKKTAKPLPDSLLLDLSNTPDLAQTIAVSCFGLGVACKLTGLQTLKIKETDRLIALKTELEKLGAVVKIDADSFQMEKSTRINPDKTIETYQDHRMAMAFAPLAIKTNLIINNAEVVSKSYPDFWNDLRKTGIQYQINE